MPQHVAIVMDGNGCLFGMLCGSTRSVLHKFSVELPKKHGRGGQSAQRFERLIEEAAHNFFKKSAERACAYWLPQIENLRGIIVGGPGATKDFVVKNDYFHHEIKKLIRKAHDKGVDYRESKSRRANRTPALAPRRPF